MDREGRERGDREGRERGGDREGREERKAGTEKEYCSCYDCNED